VNYHGVSFITLTYPLSPTKPIYHLVGGEARYFPVETHRRPGI